MALKPRNCRRDCMQGKQSWSSAGCGHQNNRKRNVAAANRPSWTQTLARKGFRSLRKSLRSHSERLTTGVTPADNKRRLPLGCTRQVEAYLHWMREKDLHPYTSSVFNWRQGHAIRAPLSQTTRIENSLKIHTKYNAIVHRSALVGQTWVPTPFPIQFHVRFGLQQTRKLPTGIHSRYMSSTTYFNITSLRTQLRWNNSPPLH